jgi:peptidoglycan/LPS O-acetylase OafA/YrhL
LLDVVRFLAAIAVVVNHLSLSQFHTGLPSLEILGYVAVPVFFVLSGFVIRYVTLTREVTLREYVIDRASRMYSVVLPAIVVTLAASAVCFVADPMRFRLELAPLFTHPILRLVLNLTFLSQSWGHNTIPFINIPFWSLGYECPYYVLYGLAFFLRGRARVVTLAIAALVLGPQILFLLPVWLLGVLLFTLYRRLRGSRAQWVILGCFIAWFLASVVRARATHSPLLRILLGPSLWIAGLPNPLSAIHLSTTRANMVSVSAGVTSFAVLLVLLLAVDRLPLAKGTRKAIAVRRIADGTFAIYLMHFPLLVMASFLGLLGPNLHRSLTVAVVICALLVWAALPLDAFKGSLRRWLRTRLPSRVKRTDDIPVLAKG